MERDQDCQNAIENAANLACQLGHRATTPLHLLYGLVTVEGSIPQETFVKLGVSPETIKSAIEKAMPSATPALTQPTGIFTSEAKDVVMGATPEMFASYYGRPMVDTEDMLYSVLYVCRNEQVSKGFFGSIGIPSRKEIQTALHSQIAVHMQAGRCPPIPPSINLHGQTIDNSAGALYQLAQVVGTLNPNQWTEVLQYMTPEPKAEILKAKPIILEVFKTLEEISQPRTEIK